MKSDKYLDNKIFFLDFYAIPKGKYLNLKTGGVYEVIGVGRHSESLKPLVVYISLASGSIFCRPASMWYKKFKKLDEE